MKRNERRWPVRIFGYKYFKFYIKINCHLKRDLCFEQLFFFLFFLKKKPVQRIEYNHKYITEYLNKLILTFTNIIPTYLHNCFLWMQLEENKNFELIFLTNQS